MERDRHRLRRLGLIARIREIEHRQAALQTHLAATEQSRHAALVERAQQLARSYDERRDAACGYDLAAQRKALVRTGEIARDARLRTQTARELVEQLTGHEMQARNRRDRVAEDHGRLTRMLRDAAPFEDDAQQPRAALARNLNNQAGTRRGQHATEFIDRNA